MSALSGVARRLPDSTFVGLIARTHRRFEPELARVVEAYRAGNHVAKGKPGVGTFLDVGAWYGPWTYWLTPMVARVVAFEPNPQVADVLERVVAPHVRVMRAAASDAVGTASLSLPRGGRGTEGRASLSPLADAGPSITAELTRIDDLGEPDVRLVKVDVEGHELAALRGTAKLLDEQYPVLVVELEHRHGDVDAVTQWLGSRDYRGFVLVRGRWTPLPEFNLAAHQAEFHNRANRSYLSAAFARGDRYINNVVFCHPAGRWGVDQFTASAT